MDMLKAFTSEQLKTEVPVFNVGDTVKVHCRIVEGHAGENPDFRGAPSLHGRTAASPNPSRSDASPSAWARKKTFPLHSPNVQKVEVVRKGRVRRAKLYYLRDRLGKSAKIKEKNLIFAQMIKCLIFSGTFLLFTLQKESEAPIWIPKTPPCPPLRPTSRSWPLRFTTGSRPSATRWR